MRAFLFARARVLPLLRILACGFVVAIGFAGCAADDSDANSTVTIAGADPTPNAAATRDREVAEVYAAAKAKDVSRLLGFVAQMPAPSPTATPVAIEPSPAPSASGLPQAPASAKPTSSPTPVPRFDPAIALALYVVDPKDYADSFVASYPSDTDGVVHDYGSRFVSAHVVPSGALFPIASLASLASGGDTHALLHLYEAMPASQGGIQAAYARQIAIVSAHDPNRAIAAIAEAAPSARLDLLANAAWCGGNGTTMMSATTTTDFQAALKMDLGDAVRVACARTPTNKPKRRSQQSRKKR